MPAVRTRSRLAAVGASVALVAAGLVSAPAAFAAPALTVEPASGPAAGQSFRVIASDLDATKKYSLRLTGPNLSDTTDLADSNSCSVAASPSSGGLACTLTESSVGSYDAKLYDDANNLVTRAEVAVKTPVSVTAANAPKVIDNAGTTNDAMTFTYVPGIDWFWKTSPTGTPTKVDFGTNPTAGTTKEVPFSEGRTGSLDVIVEATPMTGFAFPEGQPTFTFRLTDGSPTVLTVPTAAVPKAIDEIGLDNDQATFTKVDGIDWYYVNADGTETLVPFGSATSVTIPVKPVGDKHELTVYARAQAGRAFSNGRLAEQFTLTYTDAKAPITGDRVQGRDRFATAVEISKKYFDASTDVVYIANGYRQADALSAGPAAAKENAPLLLTFQDSVRDDVAAEIARLSPKTIKLVGGESVLSEEVAQRLGQIATVERLAGPNREATAAAVARQSIFNGATTVYVANGSDPTWPDAISGGSGAAKESGPLLLSRRAELSDSTVEALATFKPTSVKLVGGSEVVSTSVLTQVRSLQPSAAVTRLDGPNRYGTNADVINKVTGVPATATVAFVATGLNWPDALAGVPAAKKANAPLALSTQSCYPQPVATALGKLPLTSLVRLGGTGVLGNHDLISTCSF